MRHFFQGPFYATVHLNMLYISLVDITVQTYQLGIIIWPLALSFCNFMVIHTQPVTLDLPMAETNIL